jgi:hypothetical protein
MFGDVAAGYLKTGDGTEIIGLPFEGEVFEMVIIVPEIGELMIINLISSATLIHSFVL